MMSRPVWRTAYGGWLRNRIRTGDVVAFGGQEFWPSGFIRLMTWSEYSHVAKVLRTEGDRILMMEATTTDTGKATKLSEVQLTVLSERIQAYKGIVDVHFLSDEIRQNYSDAGCMQLLEAYEGRPYDWKGARRSGYGQWFKIPGKMRHNALFCSELCDAADVAAGLISGSDRTPTPEEYIQRDIFHRHVYRIQDQMGDAIQ